MHSAGPVPRAWVVLLHAVGAFPWLLLAWINAAIACRRWSGWREALSLEATGLAAAGGWWLLGRACDRKDDARLGDLLAQVEDAPPWALSPHPVQVLKREHVAHCYQRWGVTPKSSGWLHFRRSWRADAAAALVCIVLGLHAWWLAL